MLFSVYLPLSKSMHQTMLFGIQNWRCWRCLLTLSTKFYNGKSCQSHSQIQHYTMFMCHAKDPFFRNSLHTKSHQIWRYVLLQILLLVFVWLAMEQRYFLHKLLRYIILANAIEKQGILLPSKPHFDRKDFFVSQLKWVVQKACKILQAASEKLILQHKRISN